MKHIDFFGLSRNPFDVSANPIFYYPNRQQKKNADTILSLLGKPDAVVVLTGGIGTGKTTFVNYLQGKTRLLFFPMPVSSIEEVYNALEAISFSIESDVSASPDRKFAKQSDKNLAPKSSFTLVFDEAQNIPTKLLTDLAGLRKQVLDSRRGFPLFFIGHKTLADNISSYLTTSRDKQQNFEFFDLKPLGFSDMVEMIDFRLRVCGKKISDIFCPDAVKKIHRLSGGIPRLVNNLCGISLIITFQNREHVVSADSVQQATSIMPDISIFKIPESDSDDTDKKNFILFRPFIRAMALVCFLIVPIIIAEGIWDNGFFNSVSVKEQRENILPSPEEVVREIPGKTKPIESEICDTAATPLPAEPHKIEQAKKGPDSVKKPRETSGYQSVEKAAGQAVIEQPIPPVDNLSKKETVVAVPSSPLPKEKKPVRQKLNPNLAAAVSNGNAARVNLLLIKGADPNSTGKDNRPVLITAIKNRNFDIARTLLDKGATPDLLDENKETPLMGAAWNGDNTAATLLIEYRSRTNIKNPDGNTALLFSAIKGHEKIADLLLSHGASCKITNKHKKTALMAASWNGNLNIVRKLLKYGADVNLKDENQWTPLMFAAFQGHESIVKFIVNSGADISAKNNDGLTASALAESQGHSINFSTE